jgi:hypothetical protein
VLDAELGLEQAARLIGHAPDPRLGGLATFALLGGFVRLRLRGRRRPGLLHGLLHLFALCLVGLLLGRRILGLRR